MTVNEPPRRPTVVTAAYWLWFFAAAVCFITSVAFVTADEGVIRETRPEVDNAASLVTTLRWLGYVLFATGVLIAVLVRFVRRGDPRFRRTLAVFSGALAIFAVGMFLIVGPYGPLIAVPCLVATALVYTPSAQPWFEKK